MKATGIVRRIDDLGRVVIPKEIRRTLHIRVGEPLEIFVSSEGEVIFKKYSPMGDLSAVAGRYAEVLSKSAGMPVLVCDRDHVVTAAGFPKKDAVDRRICPAFEDIMENRRLYLAGSGNSVSVYEGGPACIAAAPIVCRGDVAGAVVFLEGASPADEASGKLLSTAAAFFGRTLED